MMMMMMLIASGWAGSLEAPQLSEPTANECDQATPIRVGGGIPPAILGPDGTARCHAVAMPTSEVAYLLKLEEYHEAMERLHALDVALLQAERDWYRDQLATEHAPTPWYETPTAQRWTGRAEVLAVLTVVTIGLGYGYNQAR